MFQNVLRTDTCASETTGLSICKSNQLHVPPSWNDNQTAGQDWEKRYRRRNTNLSFRMPENTSASRFCGFNKTAVYVFYWNLERLMNKLKSADDKYFDKSGISTVTNTKSIS